MKIKLAKLPLCEKSMAVYSRLLAINAGMFLLEATTGWLAHSISLMADALDMLGDALVYGMSLYVLTQNQHRQARVALAKGGFMLLFGLFVLGEATYKIFYPVMPNTQTMGIVGVLALTANLTCFYLLYTHREDNLNMSSTWLCSRNDLIANVGVLIAAALSYLLVSKWPDIVIGTIIALLFLKSSWHITREATIALKQPETPARTRTQTANIRIQRKKP